MATPAPGCARGRQEGPLTSHRGPLEHDCRQSWIRRVLRVEQVGKLTYTVRESRRRARVVGVSVDGDRATRKLDLPGARRGLEDIEATRSDNHELRREGNRRAPSSSDAMAVRLDRERRRRRRG